MISEKSELMRELGETQAMFTLAALMPMAMVEHEAGADIESNPLLQKVYYDDLRAALKAIALRMSEVAMDDELFLRYVLDATSVAKQRAESSAKVG